MLLPESVIKELKNPNKVQVCIDDELYFIVERFADKTNVCADVYDINGVLKGSLNESPDIFKEKIDDICIKSAEEFKYFYSEHKQELNKQIIKTKFNNLLSKMGIHKKSTIWENKDLYSAFHNLSSCDSTSSHRTFANESNIRATIGGKKPATYFDDQYNEKATEILLRCAPEIEKESKGLFKIVQQGDDKSLMLINTTNLHDVISKNLEFYKYHFPEGKDADDILQLLLKRIEEKGIRGSLMGTSLGFPVGDAMLFSKDVPSETMLKLLQGDEWAKHREVIKKGKNKQGDWCIPNEPMDSTIGYGFVTWNKEGETAKKFIEDNNNSAKLTGSIPDLMKQFSK